MSAETMFDKIWKRHEVADGLIYIDLHLVHEVTSPQAFDGLRLAGRGTGGEDDPPIHEPGSRETVVVLAGDLVLTVDGEPYPLGAGDSATFDADLPHNLHNPGETTAEILAVIAAGLRRS